MAAVDDVNVSMVESYRWNGAGEEPQESRPNELQVPLTDAGDAPPDPLIRLISEDAEPETDRELLKRLALVALPAYPMAMVQRCVGLCSSALIGHYGTTNELAAVGLANVITNVTGYSWLYGLSSAISTLSGQDWGAKNFHSIGITMQRGFVILLCTAIIPLICIWLSAKPLLIACGQNPEIAELVGMYSHIRLPGLFFLTGNCVLTRTLCAMSNVKVNLTMAVVTAVVNVTLSFSLIPQLGFIGAPITATLCDGIEFVGICILSFRDENFRKCWSGFSREAWRHWGAFLRISCPSLFLFGIEVWTWDLQNFLAGFVSPLAQATQAVAPSIGDLQYSVGQALGMAGGIVVANLLGEGKEKAARRGAWLVMMLCFGCMAFQGAIFFVLRTHLANLFTSKVEVVESITELLPLVLVFSFLDGHQSVLTGILQGAGRQYVGAPLIFVCYWLIGVPTGIVLSMGVFGPRWGLKGLWVGMLVAVILHNLSFASVVLSFNWKKITIEVQRRTKAAESESVRETSMAGGAVFPDLREGDVMPMPLDDAVDSVEDAAAEGDQVASHPQDQAMPIIRMLSDPRKH